MQPDLDEVLQTENVEPHLVPVKLCEPAEVRELPTKRIAPRTVSVNTVAGAKLLSADPRRKGALIIARTQDILIGANQSGSQLNGAWVPKTVILPITSVAEVWAVADGVGVTTDVSVIEEYWA
jgi:hypothetical protein